MADFMDKIVLITGAAGNLGYAASLAFKAQGAQLALLDRNGDRLKEIYPDLISSSRAYMSASVDLTQEHQVESAIDEVAQKLGGIDILINIAGGYRGGEPLHETPYQDMEFLFNLNVITTFLVNKAVIKYMLKSNTGAIISVAARAALTGASKMGPYSATKSAVIRLTESMAAELKFNGIRVNCILPGTIDTPQNRQAMPNADFSRWVAPEALADVILFLASDQARAISGAAIPVYGLS